MKGKLQLIMVLTAVCALLIVGCGAGIVRSASDAVSPNEPEVVENPVVGLANPASVYCEEQGGTLDIRTEEAGSIGFCLFEDGSECEEWAFYHGECGPQSADAAPTGNGGAVPVIGMANPASVYCEEQGGALDLRYDADGNQYGVCVFAGSEECEEWAFFRDECGPEPVNRLPRLINGWYGTVITPPAGQPFEHYLNLYPKEAGNAGLVPMNDEVGNTLAKLRDSGRLAHFWGSLNCAVPGFSGCQVEVTRMRPEGPGEFFAPDPVEGWLGTLESLPSGAQFDDVFTLADPLFPVRYGIDSQDEAVAAQLASLRDTGTGVSVFGDVTCGVMDTNGCQIRVSRIEGGEDAILVDLPEDAAAAGVNDWVGLIVSTPAGAQFDDYFEKLGFDGGAFGIEARDETLQQQIESLRDSGKQVHVWGRLISDVPDYGAHQIIVTHLDVDETPEGPEVVVKNVEDWVGVVVGTPDMAQVDDYFQMMDQDGTRIGIWGEGDLGDQLEALRDTGTVIHVWGIVRYNVPDAYNAQIAVTRIEVRQ